MSGLPSTADAVPAGAFGLLRAKTRHFLTDPRDRELPHGASALSKILASCKSSVPKPSVNQP